MLAMVMPTRSLSSVSDILRLAIITSRFTVIMVFNSWLLFGVQSYNIFPKLTIFFLFIGSGNIVAPELFSQEDERDSCLKSLALSDKEQVLLQT